MPSSVTSTAAKSILAVISGLSLALAFMVYEHYWIAWVCFIPLLFAVEQSSLARTYVLGLIAGLSAYICGMYWIVDFIILSKGYSLSVSVLMASAYWFYAAQTFAMLLVLCKWIKSSTSIHEFLVFPITFATINAVYPLLFSVRLAESQMYFYSAIQAVEWVGVLGLDFIIALANITLFRFLYQLFFSKRRFATSSSSSSPGSSTGTSFSAARGSSLWPWMLSVSIVVIWFSYGVRQFPQWEDAIEEWDTVTMGVVQPNEIPRIGKPFIYPGYSAAYPPEMDMTQRLASLGAELIVWPEAQIKGYFDAPEVRAAYQQSLQAMGSALLFQDMQRLKNSTDGALEKQYNTAVMLDKRGVEVGTYQKMKRMPFGEYLPMVRAGSDLEKWFKTLPGEFLNEIEEGAGHKLFEHEKVNIIPLICYETTFQILWLKQFLKQRAMRIRQKAVCLLLCQMMVGLVLHTSLFSTFCHPYYERSKTDCRSCM